MTDRFTIANEVVRVVVAGLGVVPGSKPVIEPVLIGCWFVAFFRGQSQMPFANMSGCVSGASEDFRQRSFSQTQVGVL